MSGCASAAVQTQDPVQKRQTVEQAADTKLNELNDKMEHFIEDAKNKGTEVRNEINRLYDEFKQKQGSARKDLEEMRNATNEAWDKVKGKMDKSIEDLNNLYDRAKSKGKEKDSAHAADIAIHGYDTVAYFKADTALKGSESFTFQWHDMTWYFSSKENRGLFAGSPDKYAPQYDGFCAWAMTESRKAKTDPEVWKIVNGKLYLNCSRAAFEKWSADIPGNINKADTNWKKFSGSN